MTSTNNKDVEQTPAWATPQLVCFGTVQALTAGGTAYSSESSADAPPPGSPGYPFYKS